MADDATAPVEASKAEAPKKRKGLGRGAKIGLGVLGALVLLVAVLAIWILSPAKPAAYEEPADFSTRNLNTVLYGAVESLWIDRPLVGVSDDRAQVAYDWESSRANASWIALYLNTTTSDPEVTNNTVSRDDLQRMVIGAAAEVLPESVTTLEVAQFDRKDERVTWTVAVADVRAFFAGEITLAEFESRITKA